MNPKNITLAGGVLLKLVFEDGHVEELLVRQFKLKEWPAAFAAIDDEIHLVALACGKSRPEIQELTPASYNAAHAALKEANKEGFFSYAQRQMDRGAENLRAFPPEMMEKMLLGKFTSSTRPPHIPPPAG